MEELSFPSKNAKIDCEVIVLAVYDLDEAIFDILRDVKDAG